MRIYIIKSGKEYKLNISAPDPDTKLVLDTIREIIKMMELSQEEVDNYVLTWAEEIKKC